MHYRNGREAKNGDKVLQLDFDGGRIKHFGVTFDNVPDNDYCNGYITPLHSVVGSCLVDCLHVEDVEKLIKDAGLDKRPAGK